MSCQGERACGLVTAGITDSVLSWVITRCLEYQSQ